MVDTIKTRFKEKVFKTMIRDNVALAEAPFQGLDIFRYNSKSYGAEDYLAITKELLRNNSKQILPNNKNKQK